jgi:hypothetical protein
MKNLIAIAGACLLTGGAIGYIAGNQKGDSRSSSDESSSSGSQTVSSNSRRARNSGGDLGSDDRSRTSRPRTLEEVANTPGQTARIQALMDLYSGLSRDEFPGEADKLNDLPFNERILNAYVLFAAWAEVAPYEAFDHAKTKMGRTGMFVRPTILQSWAASDPKAAAEYYSANKSDFVMMGMMGRDRGGSGSGAATIAGEWAKQDPEGALAWARSLEGTEGADASVRAISQIAATDPQRAATLTNGLEGRSLTEANRNIASEWARSDWGAAENFINSLPADQQGDAMGAAVRSLASEDPTLAASRVLEIPEGNARDEAIETVAESMAREQPAEAAQWVTENGNENAQREAMRDIMSNWVSQDPGAARDWAVSRPEGAVRDAAVSSYVMNDSNGSPAENIRLAETITDERSRGWAVGMTTMRWMSEDREAATNYIRNSDMIDDRWRDRLLRRSGEGSDNGGR